MIVMSWDYDGYSYLSTDMVYELEDQMGIDDLRRFNRSFQDIKVSTVFTNMIKSSQIRLKDLLDKHGSKFKMFYYCIYFSVDHYNRISVDGYCVDYEYKDDLKDSSILTKEDREHIDHMINDLKFSYTEPDFNTGESGDDYSEIQFLDLFLSDEEKLKGNIDYLKASYVSVITDMQRWIDDSIEAGKFMNFCPDD